MLKPSGKIIVFEHNPLNPVTRRMVDTCPFDENAVLLYSHETIDRCKRIGFRKNNRRFTIFSPRKKVFEKLVLFESKLAWLPMGGSIIMLVKNEK